jgi:hypothetical protein
MKTTNAIKTIASSAITTCASAVFAHDGHGMQGGAHWHATDALGFVVLGIVVATAIWMSRGGK